VEEEQQLQSQIKSPKTLKIILFLQIKFFQVGWMDVWMNACMDGWME
jgi:hypothetical protein